ncbi:DUF1616 domain-containing protein [Haloarcula laminariae]|uniref:DUF1616 domain-containing protein n=1 Tax=Haloarcula laminariae TaxID=2961577 RepID=UPI0021C86C41|nr:DUF1616 domain-containing protein [Halomicroarcula sp. FL173]
MVSTLLDLAVVCGIALITYAVWRRQGNPLGPARVLVGGAFVLLGPGYALTAALFPRRASTEAGGRVTLSGLERVVFTVGLSIVTVPLLALFLNYTRWGITAWSVVLTLVWFVLVAAAVAAVRRLQVPPAERYRLPVGDSLAGLTNTGPATAVIGVLFVLSVAAAGTALATTDGGQRYTEFYLMTADDETGELVADDYPESLAPIETAPLYVGIENREGQSAEYTVLVEFHRVDTVDGERTVTARWREDRYETQLRAGAVNGTGLRVSPPTSAAGERLRLTLLLYKGSTGDNPRIDGAYRSVHIWITVESSGGGA